MTDAGPLLVLPTARLRDARLAAHAEWGPGPHEDGFGPRRAAAVWPGGRWGNCSPKPIASESIT
ncbi:hypothetical protein [Amycolatopsis sp. MEPSY49]|uniref:hypothetical protein n=1 Tax=Amycolatopsis sp. MEPSY49 TaxID=3151600 RepID=UPI003EFA6A9E